MRFWDASSVVPLLVGESATATAERLYREDPHLIVWWATPVECASAVGRRERKGLLPIDVAESALARLRELAQRWDEVLPGEALRTDAIRILRMHPLRTAEALQLAAARAACRGAPGQFPFVCADQRLAAAASREGFTVIDAAGS